MKSCRCVINNFFNGRKRLPFEMQWFFKRLGLWIFIQFTAINQSGNNDSPFLISLYFFIDKFISLNY